MATKLAERREHGFEEFAANAIEGHIYALPLSDLLHSFLQVGLARIDIAQ